MRLPTSDGKVTPEERKVYNQLTEAVEEVLKLLDHKTGLLTDFIVIAAQVNARSDSNDFGNTYSTIYRDGALPYHTILGLLRAAQLNVEGLYQDDN